VTQKALQITLIKSYHKGGVCVNTQKIIERNKAWIFEYIDRNRQIDMEKESNMAAIRELEQQIMDLEDGSCKR